LIYEKTGMEAESIIPIRQSEDWFMSQLYQANHSDNETMRILKTLKRYVKYCDRDIFYSIEAINENTVRIKPLNDLADDCLIAVSLFSKHISELHRRRAAPSLAWYEWVGSESFHKLGYYDIAKNYSFWTCFIAEHIFA